jgi:DNA polymerase-3 subunit delta
MTTYAEFKRKLKPGGIGKLYLLVGPEEFLTRRLISQIVELALDGGMREFNFVEMDPASVDPPALLQELNAYPLGSAKRAVVIRDINSLSAPVQETLAEAIADLPDFLTLVLAADRMDRRKSLYKALSSEAEVVELNTLRPGEAKAWIRELLEENGKRVSAGLVESIYELTGNDLSDISNEVRNLIEYMGGRDTVTEEDVNTLVASRRKEPIYNLTDHIADRNLELAWTTLKHLLAEGEHELRILWHLDFMVKRLLRAKCLQEEGVSADTVIKTLQIKPFLKTRFLQQVRSFSLEELRRMYHAVVEWDTKFKSTSRWHPDIDLELLVRELCATPKR